MNEESVTQWIAQARDGSDEAIARLFDRYFQSLVGLARRRLRSLPQRTRDEEGVANSAFASFFRTAQENGFAQLIDRTDLRRILTMLTIRKAIDTLRRHYADRRGGLAQPEPVSLDPSQAEILMALEQWDQDPSSATAHREEFERLLDRLPEESDRLRTIAIMKFDGFSNAEIARELQVVERTIERRLGLIRRMLTEHADHAEERR